jgi:SAM-dependent methyltransferase
MKNLLKGLVFPARVRAISELPLSGNSANVVSAARKVLNVGGGNKEISIPDVYGGWQHILLDIDPSGNPDVVCDARTLMELPTAQYDAIYCSHNLEHYYRHDIGKVLAGFRHVVKDDGFIHIRVPDMQELMKRVVDGGMDIDDLLYVSAAGPIHVYDVIYGLATEIENSGSDFYAHKTGFTKASLTKRLEESGFPHVFAWTGDLEISAIAFKNVPTQYAVDLFKFRNN